MNDSTFTMTSGAIKNTTVDNGVYLYGNITAVVSGGEISGHTTSSGYGVSLVGESTHFTVSGGAVISGNKIGVNNSGGSFTMSGGTISNNVVGVDIADAPFTMSGGTISNNTAPIGGGIRFRTETANSGAFYVSGNVTIANNGVGLDASDSYSAITNTIVYIGSGFNPVGTIAIDVYSIEASEFDASWGSVAGNVFLKGGTAEAPTAVTSDQLAKFIPGKAAASGYMDDNYTLTEEKTGGSLSILPALNSEGFGVAKWTAIP
jgi:hypothetical protein